MVVKFYDYIDDFFYNCIFIYFLIAEFGSKFYDYVVKTWLDGIVKIIRIKERSGLIRVRLAGVKVATGDVLIFLDFYCEFNIGW